MQRFFDRFLDDWYASSRRKPLLVQGARQVGKTYAVEAFGRRRFETVVTIDLERTPSLRSLFEGDISPAKIVSRLELLRDTTILPGKALLFIDEIQACPRAITALRYFHEDMPDLHVVAAGSLTGFALEKVSVPVGRLQFATVRPLTFPEFLVALGREKAARLVLGEPRELDDVVHGSLLDAVREYFFVGGMPESVEAYRQRSSLRDCAAVHEELVDSYRQDFHKYIGRADPRCIDTVLASVANSIGSQIRYARLDDQHHVSTVHRAFDLLCRANVITRVSAVNPAGLPLGADVSRKRFKAILADVGLFHRLSALRVDESIDDVALLDLYRGALAEQVVGQEILAASDAGPFYWAREYSGSRAEVDYLVAVDGAVHPVEVKSSSSGWLRSLHSCLDRYPGLGDGMVLSARPLGELAEQRLRFVPLYFAFSVALPREDELRSWPS